MKKIGYLGIGAWGYALACLLAKNGHQVTAWNLQPETIDYIKKHKEHPKVKGFPPPKNLKFVYDIEEVFEGQEMIVEGVTSAGIRQVFQKARSFLSPNVSIVLTSKGIEQNTGLFLSEILLEVLGENFKNSIGCLSGPSLANEVLAGLPTSVVCSGYSEKVMETIHEAFAAPSFRVYPNSDINGVEIGGALKNIIAIASGACDGLGFGDNAKAALMTRGLHEMRRLAKVKGSAPETLNGLAGLGDLCVTCLSKFSRNYQLGYLVAKGATIEEAKKKIGMVVEGSYTCLSALQVAQKHNIDMPITEAVYMTLYENLSPKDAVKRLMSRDTKLEIL